MALSATTGAIISSAIGAVGDVAVAKIQQKSGIPVTGNTGVAGASAGFNLGDWLTLPTVHAEAGEQTQALIKWAVIGLGAMVVAVLVFFGLKKKRNRR